MYCKKLLNGTSELTIISHGCYEACFEIQMSNLKGGATLNGTSVRDNATGATEGS